MEDKKYVLITGASSGIGNNIAVQLSERYNLIINGRNNETLNEVLSNCTNPEIHIKWIYDLKDTDNIESAFRFFIEQHNISVSIFIHCAGYLKMLPLRRITKSHLNETMNVNFNSAVLLVKQLISKKINGTCLNNIVFISSTASIMGAKAFNVYSGSKGALDALMRSLAVELAPNVRVNSVLPGGIQTKMTQEMFDDVDLLKRMSVDYPLGLGEPNDIFTMVEFLISEKSKWITGQQFIVDGGRSINISA